MVKQKLYKFCLQKEKRIEIFCFFIAIPVEITRFRVFIFIFSSWNKNFFGKWKCFYLTDRIPKPLPFPTCWTESEINSDFEFIKKSRFNRLII